MPQITKLACVFVFALSGKILDAKTGEAKVEFAITIDDFRVKDAPLMSATQKNDAYLDTLKKHKVKAALFVTTQNLRTKNLRNMLLQWDEAGHTIGNHTFAHQDYHKTSFKKFSTDILKAEVHLTPYRNFRKLFRFPFLHEGNTRKKRDEMRHFLSKNSYKNVQVTVDTSDWYIESRLLFALKKAALKKNRILNLQPYRDYYLDHIWKNAQLYDGLATKILGRQIKHTLLIHHNLLNALFLDDLLIMLKAKGWHPVSIQKALTDPIFNQSPDIVPAEGSIVWSLGRVDPRFAKETRHPAESAKHEKIKMDQLKL